MTGIVGFARKYSLIVLGIVGMLVGAYLLIFPSHVASFGWTAYAPLSDTAFAPSTISPMFYVGWAAIVAGAMVVAGWVGFRLGRRRRALP
jgi:heme/copper-type cytochrome/quinol oxidase subunit 1